MSRKSNSTQTHSFLYVTGMAMLICLLSIVFSTEGWAQSRPSSGFAGAGSFGDMNALWAGLRFSLRTLATVLPFALASYYTWKFAKNAKDAYDGAWLVMAWCAVAYIIV